MGYPLPAGMQLHVVAGRGSLPPHYSTLPRIGSSTNAPTNATNTSTLPKPSMFAQYSVDKTANVKFTERGVPEGAASVQQTDTNVMLSPTAQPPTASVGTTAAGTTSAVPVPVPPPPASGAAVGNPMPAQGQGAVFYAMNV